MTRYQETVNSAILQLLSSATEADIEARALAAVGYRTEADQTTRFAGVQRDRLVRIAVRYGYVKSQPAPTTTGPEDIQF